MGALAISLAATALCLQPIATMRAAAPPDEPTRLTSAVAYAPGVAALPRIEAGRIVVKLSIDAAREADDLPLDALPKGIERFDALRQKHGIHGGRRAISPRGAPVSDPALFEKIGLDRVYVIEIAGPVSVAHTWTVVRDFSRQPWVDYAEPVYLATPTLSPNDPSFPQQWPHVNIGQTVNGTSGTVDADADTNIAWDTVTGNPGTIIAVLDSGADLDHPDLVDNLVAGYDFVNDDPIPEDTSGHGTAVAGIAAARGDNATGVAGVCWTCGIMPLIIASSVHESDAIRFAADNGADVINMSHTFGAAWIQLIIDATEYAVGLGALPFASATNANAYNIGTPAVYPEVVSVGGSDQNDVRIYAWNDLTELTAPGPNATTTYVNGNYTLFSGTSSSSPFAAGLGALLRVHRPGLHVRELRHVLRLGCDDQVGAPAEDTPGWDQFMGYGRVNAAGSLALVDGPWLALDRPHYMCAGELTVALKDTTAGATVPVTLVGSLGGDVETVMVTPVAGATGYYEGTIPLSWAGVDGPVAVGDGKLDVTHDETVDAASGGLTATAFLDCTKKVCQWTDLGLQVDGDCDGDNNLDPGELWRIAPAMVNLQTEPLEDVRAQLATTHPDVTILKPEATYGDVNPYSGGFTTEEQAFRVQLQPGAAVSSLVSFQLTISGRGWVGDAQACSSESGFGPTFTRLANRDPGAVVQTWDFDDGTAMGFQTEPAHGVGAPSGSLSECEGHWVDQWSGLPVTDRAHTGSHSMRLGDGAAYGAAVDAGLKTPVFTVPATGGAIGFRLWIDSSLADSARAWDGLVVEAKRAAESLWTYLADGSYAHRQFQDECPTTGTTVPFGAVERVAMIAGDGASTETDHDTFDATHHANLIRFAGDPVQVRFRFGSHDSTTPGTHGVGAWIDTVQIHEGYVADTWPGDAPTGLAGSEASCPGAFDLTWDAVAGAGGYEIYRSEVSCEEAVRALAPTATTAATAFSDDTVVGEVEYYWAVAATESESGCPTVRACVAGGCPTCSPPPDPTALTVGRDVDDVLLSWLGSADVGPAWNVYRDPGPDPSGWGGPLAPGVTDEDAGTPGVQHRDVGGIPVGTIQHYLVTEVTCAESPLF